MQYNMKNILYKFNMKNNIIWKQCIYKINYIYVCMCVCLVSFFHINHINKCNILWCLKINPTSLLWLDKQPKTSTFVTFSKDSSNERNLPPPPVPPPVVKPLHGLPDRAASQGTCIEEHLIYLKQKSWNAYLI